MGISFTRKLLIVAGALLVLWLGIEYLLPILLPFLLGAGIALAAEPAVTFGVRRLHLPRPLSAGIGVALTLAFSLCLLWIAIAWIIRELGQLATQLPDIRSGTQSLRGWLLNLASKTPKNLREPAKQVVVSLFDGSVPFTQQLSQRLPGILTDLLTAIGNSALGIGMGVLSGFLISVRLPVLRTQAAEMLPERWRSKWLPALSRVKSGLLGWFKAQLKLAAITWGIVTIGFWVLGVPYFPLWAVLVALVDAVPILGTGTVLIPWSIWSFLQGDSLRGVGLLAIYAAAAISRAVLEPRLVGKQLGLDPLTTLIALYAGLRLWGIGGMLLAPVIASAVKSLLTENFTP